jgi:uncharacterized membrane protein YphA (DoxX/SURF4 family)
MVWLTILTELLGGLAVLLSAFVPLVSVPMAGVLLVAMFSVHWQYGVSSIARCGNPGRSPIRAARDTNVICSIWRV